MTENPLSPAASPAEHGSSREVRLVVAFWAAFGLIAVANRALALGLARSGWRDTGAALVVAAVESAIWASVTLVVFRRVDRYARLARPRASVIGQLALAGTPLTVAAAALGTLLRVEFRLMPASSRGEDVVRLGIAFGSLYGLVVYGAIAAAAFARAYSRRWREREADAARLEAQLASARLDALRRQLDPHFLFNTLNLIASLADIDPPGVRRMIARLSDLLRFSLEGADAAEHSLRRELALLERYLDIVRMRFAGRLTVETTVDESALDALVPSLILQPLVENAVKHGVEKLRGPARVEIDCRRDGDALRLRVRDNGPVWDRAPDDAAAGVGVRNTVARLRQLHGASATFTLAAAPEGGTVAEVRVPLREPAVLHARGVAEVEPEAARVG